MNARNEKKVVRTGRAAIAVIPEMVGHTLAVPHNGKKFIPGVCINENMVGHKLGRSSAPARTFKGHSVKATATRSTAAKAGAPGQIRRRHGIHCQTELRAESRRRRARLVLELIKGRRVEQALDTLAVRQARHRAGDLQAAALGGRERELPERREGPRRGCGPAVREAGDRQRRSAHEAHPSGSDGKGVSLPATHLAHRAGAGTEGGHGWPRRAGDHCNRRQAGAAKRAAAKKRVPAKKSVARRRLRRRSLPARRAAQRSRQILRWLAPSGLAAAAATKRRCGE